MTSEAIGALSSASLQVLEPSLQPLAGNQLVQAPTGLEGKTGFGALVTQGLNQVNEQLMVNQTDLQQLAVGNVENLHQLMMRLEESRLSFQLVMQVRNRLLEAYQDVMKMPV